MSTDESWDGLQQKAIDEFNKDNHELTFEIGKVYGEVGWYPHEGFTLFEFSVGKRAVYSIDLVYLQVAYLHIALDVDLTP